MDKKTVLAIGLIILVLGIWQLVVIPIIAPPPPLAPPPAEDVASAPALPATTPTPSALPAAALVDAAAPAPPPVPAAAPERIAVARPKFEAVFTNVGGGLESWRLHPFTYAKDQKDAKGAPIGGQPLELVRRGADAPPLSFSFIDPATQAGFAAPMAQTATAEGFTLAAADAHGLRVTRDYRFSPDGYTVEMTVTLENLGQIPRTAAWEMVLGPGVDRHLPEKDRSEEVASAFAAGKRNDVKAKKVGDRTEIGPVTWVGVGTRYFLAALLPREGDFGAFVRRRSDAGEEVGVRSGAATLLPRQIVVSRLAAYLGPKERGALAAADRSLEQSIDYGWFSWLALPFLGILQFCYRYLHSYGLAILALTLLVKAALFPISFKMFRSMKKMQDVAPRLQALKAKYKGDSQGMQQATMAIYKEHGVNPMAGCLPMLVQIPVFFALYRVLYNAFELRAAGFLYIPDLSLKDPYYITPLLMGATMLIQQRMTPSAGDPMQQRMMMFMPVIFTAMFINFSSGLVLYFLFSNCLSIGEQKLFRIIGARGQKTVAAPAPEEPPAGGKKKKGR